MNNKSLFIFRRDLRLEDNTGLLSALSQSRQVLPCFFLDKQLLKNTPIKHKNNNAIQFMIESLHDLDQQLKIKGTRLHLFFGKAHDIIKELISNESFDSVYFNDDYTLFSRKRDENIQTICKKRNVRLIRSTDLLLINDPKFITRPYDGRPYTIFTHFFNRAVEISVPKPRKNKYKNYSARSSHAILGELDDYRKEELYRQLIGVYNTRIYSSGGRGRCLKILSSIKKYQNYGQEKDYPAEEMTTGLSAHNKFGTCSIREIYHSIRENLGIKSPLLRQLFWRDFFTYIAYHYPHVFKQPYQLKYLGVRWSKDSEKFKRWANGKTGFPIVDAGMRQLNITGFMHNRVRLIVASFLTKDLHLDWRLGERYFAEKLVDYDPCVNNGNWQWSASTGCDPQPYFRIFNPWLQQKKFDPYCKYIKEFVPELRNLSPQLIHELYQNDRQLEQSKNYPSPMVDHKSESKNSIHFYNLIRNNKNN